MAWVDEGVTVTVTVAAGVVTAATGIALTSAELALSPAASTAETT